MNCTIKGAFGLLIAPPFFLLPASLPLLPSSWGVPTPVPPPPFIWVMPQPHGCRSVSSAHACSNMRGKHRGAQVLHELYSRESRVQCPHATASCVSHVPILNVSPAASTPRVSPPQSLGATEGSAPYLGGSSSGSPPRLVGANVAQARRWGPGDHIQPHQGLQGWGHPHAAVR